ncbi:uncharacterized protein BCR38DRAFT_115590 [Pseudomassariella vexata]|uniref:DUF7892 domain-containing protein n=1 Tax=Pseudomassariella vexata TaxID=1141098 RepID=A0A1Y2DBL2_9PEZI|nr:uncharacterized protein BCR38DRAFT_115590 [Pseudomassariella vexata]ORY56663.1 hypothetical protein BCR38DRAFT_115590 [Pseudomassariella vexata]
MEQSEASTSAEELSDRGGVPLIPGLSSLRAGRDQSDQVSTEGEMAVDDLDGDDDGNASSDSDSDSDISMSADSENEDEMQQNEAMNSATPRRSVLIAQHLANHVGIPVSRKRKPSHSEATTFSPPESTKKLKMDGNEIKPPANASSLPSDKSRLPAEIWHRVFTFCPPRTLGKLLQINKLFNCYLDPSASLLSDPPRSLAKNVAQVTQPDAIWQASRRRYWSKMPTPLKGRTELDMWRLACGKECQQCGKKGQTTAASANKLLPGPGTDGVRIIWPFAVVFCGPCLLSNITKDIDLLFSSSIPSAILPALPFVLITDDLHAFSSSSLQKGMVPEGVQGTKVFLTKHVEKLKDEFEDVKSMGRATAEEWLKGLEDRGKEHRNDSARWEKWESSGGVANMQTARIITANGITASTASGGMTPVPGATGTQQSDGEASSRPQVLAQNGQQHHQPRARTREEANEMRAARRAEIERRAMLLEPPLPSNVLALVPSFQAALQITSLLDDAAWDLLKPRLLAQRADAEQREQREQEIAAHSRIVQERSEQRRHHEGPNRESKELTDKDWDDIQAPLRAQISEYADEIIRDGWDDGNKVTKDNCPLFAVDVLLYVRNRFYAEVAKNAAAARAAGQEPLRDPPEGPFTQKLTLENMKWLFETKIKPHTESFRRELFLCHDCDGNMKAYGFEGVIQHYAAKHTNSLSLGTVVVHWRSEWPEKPPFKPDPLAKNSPARPQNGKSIAPTGTPQLHVNALPPGPSPHQPPAPALAPPQNYGRAAYPDPYGHTPPQFGGGAYGPQGPYHPPQAVYGQAYPPQPTPFTSAYNSHPLGPGSVPPPVSQFGQNYNAYQSNGQVGYPTFQSTYPDKIRAQLDDLARNSREVWMALVGLKQLPGNIRVYVVLYHMVKRYRARFQESPPLAMFIDGLSNNKEMRPVRNVNGLMCKACQIGIDNGTVPEAERKSYSLPQLVNHFQQSHVAPLEAMGAPVVDWTIGMVYVSDLSSLSNLRVMVGMDNHKYALITEAFLPPPLPGSYQNPGVSVIQPTWGSSADYYADHSHVPPQGPLPNLTPATYHQASGSNLILEYDPDQAILRNTYPYTPDGKVNLQPSSAVYTSPQPALQHGSSGRTSPDLKQAGNVKSRKGKGLKEKKAGSNHSNKPRKGSVKPNTKVDSKQEEEDQEAAHEQQRQEEAIRAMWANERRDAARLVSASVAPPSAQGRDDSPRRRTPDDAKQVSVPRQPQVFQASRGNQEPAPGAPPIENRGDDDLFAVLESHLAQQPGVADHGSYRQRTSSTMPYDSRPPSTMAYEPRQASSMAYVPRTASNEAHEPRPADARTYEPRPAGSVSYEPQPAHDPQQVQDRRLRSSLDSHRSYQQPEYHRGRSRSPAYVRYEPQPHEERYRDRNPARYSPDSAYNAQAHPVPHHTTTSYSSRPAALAFNEPYGMAPSPSFRRTYTDEERRQTAPAPARYTHEYLSEPQPQFDPAPVPYTENYELLKMRDSQGEYYIKRRIRRDPEPVYARYEDERPFYHETAPRRSYEYDPYSRQPVYEPVSRSEYRPAYDTVARAESANRNMSYSGAHQPGPATYSSMPRPDDSGRQRIYSTARQPEGTARHRTFVPPPDSDSNEEYDPRFPAELPSTAPPRRLHYP